MNNISKSPNEKHPVYFNFSSDLLPGETISSIVLTCVNEATGVTSATTIIDSSSIASPNVKVVLKGGTEGQSHAIQCVATTSLGNTYDLDLRLVVEIDVDDSFTKQPGDSFVFGVDFTNRLADAETVATAAVSALKESDGSSVYGSVVLAPSVITPMVGVPVLAGVSGYTYLIAVRGITSLGYTYEKFIRMTVQEF